MIKLRFGKNSRRLLLCLDVPVLPSTSSAHLWRVIQNFLMDQLTVLQVSQHKGFFLYNYLSELWITLKAAFKNFYFRTPNI